jgi:hypothetical protein
VAVYVPGFRLHVKRLSFTAVRTGYLRVDEFAAWNRFREQHLSFHPFPLCSSRVSDDTEEMFRRVVCPQSFGGHHTATGSLNIVFTAFSNAGVLIPTPFVKVVVLVVRPHFVGPNRE